jgi:hypothetical protein
MMAHPEERLPAYLRAKAVRSGNEFGWHRDSVLRTLAAARDAGLACLGGQVQFLFDDGTCELYWLNFDSSKRAALSWNQTMGFAADELLAALGSRSCSPNRSADCSPTLDAIDCHNGA